MSTAPEEFTDLLDTKSEDAVQAPPRPSGTYIAEVVSVEDVKSSRKGTPGSEFLLARFDPTGDVDQDSWEVYGNSPVIDMSTDSMKTSFWHSPKALFMLKDFCIYCGVEASGRTVREMREDTIGRKVRVKVIQKVSDNGRPYSEIEEFAAA